MFYRRQQAERDREEQRRKEAEEEAQRELDVASLIPQTERPRSFQNPSLSFNLPATPTVEDNRRSKMFFLIITSHYLICFLNSRMPHHSDCGTWQYHLWECSLLWILWRDLLWSQSWGQVWAVLQVRICFPVSEGCLLLQWSTGSQIGMCQARCPPSSGWTQWQWSPEHCWIGDRQGRLQGSCSSLACHALENDCRIHR